MIPEDRAVKRVKHRVRSGGHDVPEDKIRERHRRLWALVADAIVRCDRLETIIPRVLSGERLREDSVHCR